MAWPTIFANLAAGNQPLSIFDAMFAQVAQLIAIPCTASGANAIVLTGIGNSPTLNAYNNFQMFRFKAAGNSSGAVTIQFAGLSALPAFQKDGVTQCTTGSLVGGNEYLAVFDLSRNAGAGGFYLEDAAQPLAQGASPVWGPFTSIASAATTDLSTATTIDVLITGNASITSLGPGVNLGKVLRFNSTPVLTQGAALNLPGGRNIQVAAGDLAMAFSDASANWYVLYQKVSGQPNSSAAAGLPLVSNGLSTDSTYQVLPVGGGGTGANSQTAHDVLVGAGAAAFSNVAPTATTGVPLVSNGTTSDPSFSTASVAGGGTGATTLTAHGVLVGEGTSAVVATAVGTAGQVLTSNGAGNDPTFQTPVGGGTIATPVQLLTASQTVTIPTNATKCKVTLVGGGGGSGGAIGQAGTVCSFSTSAAGGPGGAAGALNKFLTGLTAGNTLILTIGGAGSAGSNGPGAGGNGGDTTLASGTQTITTLTAAHGSGGGAATSASASVAGTIGASGTATNGDLNMSGGNGANGCQPGAVNSGVGASAFSISGSVALLGPSQGNSVQSTIAGGATAAGKAGTGFGSGAAGGVSAGVGTAVAGAAGTAGVAIFEWYA